MKSRFFTLIVLAAMGMQSAMACVGCRTDGAMIEEQTVQAGIGFSWSIIFMLVVVFSILSSLTWYIIRSCQRLDRIHAQAGKNDDHK